MTRHCGTICYANIKRMRCRFKRVLCEYYDQTLLEIYQPISICSNLILLYVQVKSPTVLEVYQSRVQSTIYTHVMIYCNTRFVLYYNILLMQPFRVSSVDVSYQAESHNPRVLLYSILYTFASTSILAYSTWCINANI